MKLLYIGTIFLPTNYLLHQSPTILKYTLDVATIIDKNVEC